MLINLLCVTFNIVRFRFDKFFRFFDCIGFISSLLFTKRSLVFNKSICDSVIKSLLWLLFFFICLIEIGSRLLQIMRLRLSYIFILDFFKTRKNWLVGNIQIVFFLSVFGKVRALSTLQKQLTEVQQGYSWIYRYVVNNYWLLHFVFESCIRQNLLLISQKVIIIMISMRSFIEWSTHSEIITIQQLNSLYRIMSIIISKCEEICNSPLNNSKAKMLYTFSKQPRFHRTSKILCDKLYDLPSSKNHRAAGFGYGNKYDFTKDVPNSPSPNTYLINSIFENNKKGFGFGEGRQEMETTGMMANIKSKNTPGPGTYQMNSTLNKIAYTLKERTKLQNLQVNKVPGPGRYETTFSMNKTGHYFLSKHNNSRATVFNSKSSQRFKYKQNKVPGPGNYDLQNISMSPLGEYYNSKFHGSQVRTFGHEMRRTESLNKLTPGPGYYKLPSEFGHYISKCAYKGDENNQQAKENAKKSGESKI